MYVKLLQSYLFKAILGTKGSLVSSLEKTLELNEKSFDREVQSMHLYSIFIKTDYFQIRYEARLW